MNFKLFSRILLYTLVGIFYRKDIRQKYYRIQSDGSPLWLNNTKFTTEGFSEASKRIANGIKITPVKLKDRLNNNRLSLGVEIANMKNTSLFLQRLRVSFLTDLFIGDKLEKVYDNDKYLCFYRVLCVIKKLTDYSLHLEVRKTTD